MSAKFSTNYWAKMKRIQRLPKLGNDIMFGVTKKDALGVIKEFHDGIKRNSLGLDPLQQSTVNKKASAGNKRPENPLYAYGDEETLKSYVNMMRIRKLKNGWKVAPSWAKHHTRGSNQKQLELRHLFQIHEYGCTIDRGNFLIQIPPRPAFLFAYRKWMSKRRKNENTIEVKKAMTEYINKGTSQYVDKYMEVLADRKLEAD